MPGRIRAAWSAAAWYASRAWLSRLLANRCWLCPPALVRPWTCRWPIFDPAIRSPASRAIPKPPLRTSRRPHWSGGRISSANAASSGSPAYAAPKGSRAEKVDPSAADPARAPFVTPRAVSPCRPRKLSTHRSNRSRGTGAVTTGGSDVEAERPQLPAAVVGDLVRAPRGHPHPVDGHVVDQPLEGALGLVLDDVRERAGRRGERHVEDDVVSLVEVHAVDEAEVDDVDAELGVDDVLHRLGDVVDADGRRAAASSLRNLGEISVVSHCLPPMIGRWRPSRPSTTVVRTSRGTATWPLRRRRSRPPGSPRRASRSPCPASGPGTRRGCPSPRRRSCR